MNAHSLLNVVTAPVRAVTAPIRAAVSAGMDALGGDDAPATSASTPADAAAANAAARTADVAKTTNTTNNAPYQSSAANGAQQQINQSQKALSGDQEMFLKLLTAQLRNQDPLSPLDANQFTAQLVQMNGVQQQIMTNQLLNQLVANQGGIGNAVGLIGKQVNAATAASTLQGGEAKWTYSLDANATDVTLQVIDSLGNVVWSGDGADLTKGEHGFTWDGKDLKGVQRADGSVYGLKVIAKAADGQTIGSSVSLKGQVLSVQTINGETVVDIAGTKVPIGLVTQVMHQA